MVVLTYRDDDIDDAHPLRRLLGALSPPSLCSGCVCSRWSRRAVDGLAADAGVDPAWVFTTTHGNPFFVTEVLAYGGNGVPATVVDAVMARIRQLPRRTRDALEQLAVVPSQVEHSSPEPRRGRRGARGGRAEADLEVRAEGIAFRHELARRALLRSVPRTRQVALHRTCLRSCSSRSGRTCPGSCTTRWRPATSTPCSAAARRPGRLPGRSHRQALSHYEQWSRTSPCCRRRNRPGCWSTTPGSCTSPALGRLDAVQPQGAEALGIAGRPGGRGRRQGRAVALVVHGRTAHRGDPRGRTGSRSAPAHRRRRGARFRRPTSGPSRH